ncbi:MAG: ATP-binding protein [Oscillochloris sp.]|nr:ATP-binding protein [Oscillochloris sp.]
MELSLPSELGYEVVARDAVAAFARRLGLRGEKVEDLKTALCEACINAIEHGNSLNPELRVRVICQLEPDRLVIDVCDEGRKTFSVRSEPLSMAEKLSGLGSLRGMGLMLISQLCDESGFVAHSGAGNCFRFAFHRPSFSR